MTTPTFEAGVRAGLEAAAGVADDEAARWDASYSSAAKTKGIRHADVTHCFLAKHSAENIAALVRSIDPATITPPAGEG